MSWPRISFPPCASLSPAVVIGRRAGVQVPRAYPPVRRRRGRPKRCEPQNQHHCSSTQTRKKVDKVDAKFVRRERHRIALHGRLREPAKTTDIVDIVGKAIAAADGGRFAADRARYRLLAVAAIRPLAKPTEAMVDAAHEAVWFDAHWAINNRRDFEKAVKAMITEATRGDSD